MEKKNKPWIEKEYLQNTSPERLVTKIHKGFLKLNNEKTTKF